jgi:TonB family protein
MPKILTFVIGLKVHEAFGAYGEKDALRNCPNLQGRVTLRFTIAPDGSVREARALDSDVPDAMLGACVVRQVRTVRLPAPEGGAVTVVYPILFSRGG